MRKKYVEIGRNCIFFANVTWYVIWGMGQNSRYLVHLQPWS